MLKSYLAATPHNRYLFESRQRTKYSTRRVQQIAADFAPATGKATGNVASPAGRIGRPAPLAVPSDRRHPSRERQSMFGFGQAREGTVARD